MDNFKFDMTSEGDLTLKAALKLFSPPGGKVTGYSVDRGKAFNYRGNLGAAIDAALSQGGGA